MIVDPQSDELQEALKHLSSLKPKEHWFCQSKNLVFTHKALHLFSYPENDALKWLKNSISLQLSSCHLCVKEYHNSKRELRRDMGVFEDAGIEEFFKRLYEFDVSRLSSCLEECCHAITLNPKLKSSEISPQGHVAMFECIFAPILLRSSTLYEHFKTLFLGIQANGGFLRAEMVPGILTLLFVGDVGLRTWAEKSLLKLSHRITSKEFHSLFRYEFEETKRILLGKMSKYQWRALSLLVKSLDKNAILSGICGEGFDIVKYVYSNLLSQHSSVRLEIFQIFTTLLSTLGFEFWVRLLPLSCLNAVDQIASMLKDSIKHPEILRDDELSESFSWVTPLLCSQKGHLKLKTAQRLCYYFFDQWQAQCIPTQSKQVSLSFGLLTLRTILGEASQANYIDCSPDRLLRKEIRQVVDVYQDIILSSLGHPDSIAIIGLCIEIDANQVKQEFIESPSDLWDYHQTISILPKTLNTNLFKSVLSNLLPSIMVESSENLIFSTALQKFRNGVSSLLQQLLLLSSSDLKTLLIDEKTQKAITTFLVSPYTEWTQAAIDTIKQAFDATSRSDGIRGLVQLCPNLSIRNISSAFEQVVGLKNLSSTRRAVRFGGDFLENVVNKKDSSISIDCEVIQLYWKSYWGVVVHGFSNAASWAETEDKYQLVEFMRGLIDVALELIEGIETAMKGSVPSHSRSELLNAALDALPHLVIWLRLNDKQLLVTTVSLICRMLRKFVRAGVKVPKKVLLDLEKCTTSKKRLMLDDHMREDIWIALSEHEDGARLFVEDTPEQPTKSTGKIDFVKWRTHCKSKAPLSDLGSSWQENAVIIDDVSYEKKDPTRELHFKSSNQHKIRPNKKSSIKSTSHSAMQQLKGDFSRDRRILPKPIRISNKKPRLLGESNVAATDSISASDSEESSNESDSNGLFSLAKTHNSPPRIRQTERREIKILDGTSESRRAETERQRRIKAEQNAKARLTPDLSSLHKVILSWSPYHEGPLPPDAKEADYLKVSNSFDSAEQYAQTFQPLLLLEVWQQIVRAKEECSAEVFKATVEGRSSVDDMVEIQANVEHETFKTQKLGDADIIVISNCVNPLEKGPNYFSFIAKIHGISRKKDIVELAVRCLPPYYVMQQLRMKTDLTPIHREYSALKGLAYYDLCSDIVRGKPSAIQIPLPHIVRDIVAAYNLNEPQARAVAAVQSVQGFSLIQGPPGTGKTKTILGMVAAFLKDQRNKPVQIARPGIAMVKVIPTKILLCAPSNAAIDEILLRLKSGILGPEKWVPKVVRVGQSDLVNPAVKDVTLDEQVDRAIGNFQSSNVDVYAIREMLNKVLEERDSLNHEAEQLRQINKDASVIEEKIRSLNQKKMKLGQELDDLRDKQNADNRRHDFQRRSLQMEILNDADIICCTLSGSGHEVLTSMGVNFETVIIDEAAQCIELSALIPLKYGCKRCILVGDPNQLPPTVLSQAAAGYAYEQSLFVRMQSNYPASVHLLSIQYRMHPEISLFPSRKFYNSKLLDGPNVALETRRPWHKSSLFTEYRFFDIGGHEEVAKSKSVMNRAEINVAIQLYERIQTDFPNVDFDGKIGIVTPYKQQWRELKRQFQSKYGGMIFTSVDFNTVDGFQGQEKDIIIFSCVRASEGTGIGFLADVRRMNVALTRAKSSLFILGNVNSLQGNSYWSALIQDARDRNLITRVCLWHTCTEIQWRPNLFQNGISPRGSLYQKDSKRDTTVNPRVCRSESSLTNGQVHAVHSQPTTESCSPIFAVASSRSSSFSQVPLPSSSTNQRTRSVSVTKKRSPEQSSEDIVKSKGVKQTKKEELSAVRWTSECPSRSNDSPNESPKKPLILVKRPKKDVDLFIRRKPRQVENFGISHSNKQAR